MDRILGAAYRAWKNGEEFRQRRRRLKNFTYGRQWEDMVTDPATGRTMTERAMAVRETGRQPITNNLIRRLVKTVIGRFRNEHSNKEPPEKLKKIYDRNQLTELDCRLLEEFLISGCAVQRVSRECRERGRIETFIDNVSPDNFFVSDTRDTRGWDIMLTGQLHDMSISEVIMKFAHGSRDKAEEFRKVYSQVLPDRHRGIPLGMPTGVNEFFESPTGRCRVIEVWTLESHERLRCHDRERGIYYETGVKETELPEGTESRWELVTEWHCRYYAPDGTLLDSYQRSGKDGGHPYVLKLYPLTDGEIHSFVEDIVGQQQQINRLTTLIDHILSTSAKGTLLFPVRSKPESISWDEIAQRWAITGSIIPYNASPGMAEPKQVTSSGLDAGASKLLEFQMKMIDEVSGVGDLLLGRNVTGNVSAERYESQINNASAALTDILGAFADLLEQRDKKAAAF